MGTPEVVGAAERRILEPLFGALDVIFVEPTLILDSQRASTTVYVALHHQNINSEKDHRPQFGKRWLCAFQVLQVYIYTILFYCTSRRNVSARLD